MSDKKTGNKIYSTSTFSRIEQLHPLKTFLFFAMVGSTLVFLSLLCVYIMNSDFALLSNYSIPKAFTIGSMLVLFSNFCISHCVRAYNEDRIKNLQLLLSITLILTTAFCICQFYGWKYMFNSGLIIANAEAMKYLYIVSGLYMLHLIIGIGSLVYFNLSIFTIAGDIVKSLLYFSNKSNKTRLEILTVYWHFTTFLWLTLFTLFLISM